MSDADAGPRRARVRDLLRPSRLYAGIDAAPTFVRPTLLIALSSALYLEVAAKIVLPTLVSSLLDRALVTESALRRSFHMSLLVGSCVLPLLWVPLGALTSWIPLKVMRQRVPYPLLVSLLAYSALWIALGFLVKAILVLVTGHPAPSTNLGPLLQPQSTLARAVVSLTNPFLIASVVWTVRGLRHWGVGTAASLAGGVPWIATAVLFATAFAGEGRLGIAAPVVMDDWPVIQAGSVSLRHPPEFAAEAATFAADMDAFSGRLADRFGFEVRPVRVYLYPNHPTLEQAIAERLHVLVTGSIRGTDLLYVEMPGQNAAVPRETGIRHLRRYVGIMQLAPATTRAPRWFVEGIVHAAAFPGDAALDREFRDMVARIGVPDYDTLLLGTAFRSPEGPLLARSLVDHIASVHGANTLVELARDVVKGDDFRDALFARTRWTASELEAGWQANLERILIEEGGRRRPSEDSTTASPAAKDLGG
ncbi:MAG: hypothetical protein DHS20C21_09340 [Gemmatimonadota bacterium]|nr:MAG: hypothetical protein DHS20C21_09340 [Gemmatimonadota bacterium]